ncbi:MAG: hypothetical protein P4L51_10930 [Puia sp.]|nr:hypothetical protein [Puia sp.]
MKSIFCVLSLSCLFSCHLDQGKEYLASISSLPAFDMLLMDSSTVFHAKQIPDGKSIVVLYFRPDCIHCQKETNMLLSHIEALRNVQIYLLTGASFEDVKKYYKSYHLDKYQNITVGKDYEHSFTRIFKPTSIPYMAIYDTDKKLKRIYYGEVDIDILISSVHA